jgi:hypothetical protein
MVSEFALIAIDEPEPWDRQGDESAHDFASFTVYRNLGPKRTYAATARVLGVTSTSNLSKKATLHNWQDRAEAWDFYIDRIRQAEIAERQSRLAKEQFDLASKALEAANVPVKALLDRMETDPEGVLAEFGAKDITKLLKMAQDSIRLMPTVMAAQRLALGQPTEITEVTETHNVNYNDAQRIGEVLDVLNEAGVLAAFVGSGATGEIIDAEAVEVDDDRPDTEPEADSLPSGSE